MASPTDLEVPGYQPESPFLSEPLYRGESSSALDGQGPTTPTRLSDSPFVAEYDLDGGGGQHPEATAFLTLVEELHDHEFVEMLADVVGELREVAYEYEGTTDDGQLESLLWQQLAPAERQVQDAFDQMAADAGELDLQRLTDAEFEELLDRFVPEVSAEAPVMDQFVGRAVRRVGQAVRRGVQAAGRALPMRQLLEPLRKLVRPLLQRVLRAAIGQLPPQFRQVAQRLAARFAGEVAHEPLFTSELHFIDELAFDAAASETQDALATGANLELVALEFDAFLAAGALQPETAGDLPEMVELALDAETAQPDDATRLHAARETFARALVERDASDALEPPIQQFVAAILPALRIALRIIGRQRVVDFLAQQLAQLIQPLAGPVAGPLSTAIVDKGLGLLGLEVPPVERQLAGAYAVAQTVEDTVRELALAADDEVLEDQAALAILVHEAFDAAVAANLPADLVKAELREAPDSRASWTLLPASGQKRYKKYGSTPTVTITPPMAARLTTFGGISLRAVLRDQLGLPIATQPVKARVHIYEAIAGTTLSHISLLERATPGLGSASRAAWSQIHPLTGQAAAILFPRDVGLGRDVPARFLVDRNLIRVGQRFYFLEIEGARATTTPRRRRGRQGAAPTNGDRPGLPAAPRPPRPSQGSAIVNLRQGTLVLAIFLSEAEAQDLAKRLRSGANAQAAALALHSVIGAGLRMAFDPRRIQVIREAPTLEDLLPQRALAEILRRYGPRLAQLVLRWLASQLASYLQTRLAEFTRQFLAATDDPADGVTVRITIQVSDLARMLRPIPSFPSTLPGTLASIEIHPGFRR